MSKVIHINRSKLKKYKQQHSILYDALRDAYQQLDYIANFYVYPQDVVTPQMAELDQNFYNLEEKQKLYWDLENIKHILREIGNEMIEGDN